MQAGLIGLVSALMPMRSSRSGLLKVRFSSLAYVLQSSVILCICAAESSVCVSVRSHNAVKSAFQLLDKVASVAGFQSLAFLLEYPVLVNLLVLSVWA